MFNRDSALWTFNIAAAVVTALVANLHLFPWFSEDTRHWLSLAAFLVGTISGVMKTSPRPHSEEGDAKITVSGR